MANVVVVGSQWGDEGKGKIVDWLSEQADIVVRFQGGHNAGHTLVINGTTYKLSLLPSGVVRPGKLSVIGNGVVLDPQALLDEIAQLKKQGVTVTPDNLRIAENTALILPLHRELDAIRESASAALRIGTTRRGIGPAYEDKVGRRAIRLMDLADGATLDRKIDRLLAHHNALRRGLRSCGRSTPRTCARNFCAWRRRCCPTWIRCGRCSTKNAARASAFCSRARRARCSTSITAPIPSSPRRIRWRRRRRPDRASDRARSATCSASARPIRRGSARARFRPNCMNEIGEMMGDRGKEFGVKTGRTRRCGWFDAVLVRQTVRISGINGLALTKLDILDGFDEIKVCTGYRLDGREIDYLPASERAQAQVEPIYETIDGWKEQTARARSWADLPAQAIKYVRRIEELVGCSAVVLSTSPEREDTILMQNPFEA